MELYDAVAIAEGFCDHEPTMEESLEAWAHLIKTGHCWSLQGWFGRTATSFIEQGVIDEDGKINWETVAYLQTR